MSDVPLQQAEQLLGALAAALAEVEPERAATAARSVDQLIRTQTWSTDELRMLSTAVGGLRTEGLALRQRLLTDLRHHRRKRSHLLRYQNVKHGR